MIIPVVRPARQPRLRDRARGISIGRRRNIVPAILGAKCGQIPDGFLTRPGARNCCRRRRVDHRDALPGLEPDPNSTGAEEHGKMGLNVVVLQPLGALIAGILILIMPRLLNFIVALYLILIGLIGLAPHFLR
jgi:hypothetical protein